MTGFKKLIITSLYLLSLLVCGSVAGQTIRFTHVWNHTDFGMDLNYLYNYNIYEHNRWGAGLYLSTPLKYDTRYGTQFQNSFFAHVYAGYGTGDKAWKYGASAGLSFPRNIFRRMSVCYQHDLLRVGSHSFDEYNILNTSNNSSYFSSHYCGTDRIAANALFDIPGPGVIWLDYNYSRERYLFDATGLIFPAIEDTYNLRYDTYNEIGIDLYWGNHWKFGLLTDLRREDKNAHLYNFLPGIHYLRFLAQYSNPITLNDKGARLSLFAQAGIVSDNAPLSRRFDLGGTGGGRYYFNNTFLTVRPNTFMADAFALVCIRYTTGFSLWKSTLSSPHPFVQLNTMWGFLYGKDVVNGTKIVTLAYTQQDNQVNISITAPYAGLLEPGIGIDQLLHWGVLDMGVAAAYQLTKKNSPYHLDNFFNKFAVILVAELAIK